VVEWFSKHRRAFWRSGPENLYTFIWWGVLGAIVAGVLAAVSWVLPRVAPASDVIVGVASKWEDRFLSVFVAFLLSILATGITLVLRGWRSPPRSEVLPEPPEMAGGLRLRDSISMVVARGPENTKDVPLVHFSTLNRVSHEIGLPGEPQTLRFIFPVEQTVRERDLPAEVPVGKGKLIVKRFTKTGFAFEEQNTEGDQVRAEVYYVNEVAAKPAGAPVAPSRPAPAGPPPLNQLPIVYGDDEKGVLHVKFAPDTGDSVNADYVLLIVYGYKLLRGYQETQTDALRDSFIESTRRRPFPHSIAAEFQTRVLAFDVDAVADPYVGTLLDRRGLARGGTYRVSDGGIARANWLLADMIERA